MNILKKNMQNTMWTNTLKILFDKLVSVVTMRTFFATPLKLTKIVAGTFVHKIINSFAKAVMSSI